MYEGHFELSRRPFVATPDPHCCYVTPTQAPLLEAVARCIDLGQGMAIMTGPAGIGKTLYSQVLLNESQARFEGVYLGTGQFPTCRALLQAVLYELGQPYGGMTDQELRLELNTALRSLITRKDGLLLVLDEAHLLSDRLLEEVRLLSDLAQQGVPLTRVVLAGNPEFEERLTSAGLAAFNQRVACHIVLETLTRSESIAYLEHRVKWAGGSAEEIFDAAALQLIAEASDGIPRCLNQLADHAMMQAFLAGQKCVSSDLVRETLTNLQHLPLRWNPSALWKKNIPSSAPATLEPDDSDREETQDEPEDSCCFEFGAGVTAASTIVETDNSAARWTTASEEQASASEETWDDSESTSAGDETEVGETDVPTLSWETSTSPAVPVLKAPVHDEFAGSSFSIPVRRPVTPTLPRTSTPGHAQPALVVVEHEEISSAPMSAAELRARFRPLSLPGRSTRWLDKDQRELPPEEFIFDPYASLDAPLAPVFPQPPMAFPEIVVPVRKSSTALANAEAPLLSEEQSEELLDFVAPSELAELPAEEGFAPCQLAAVANVELITEYGIERVDVDLSADIAADIPLVEAPAGQWADASVSTVFEIGRPGHDGTLHSEFRAQDLTTQLPVLSPSASPLDRLLDNVECEFDIVEPEPEPVQPAARSQRSHELEERFAQSEHPVPAPSSQYKNFFSVLRRKARLPG